MPLPMYRGESESHMNARALAALPDPEPDMPPADDGANRIRNADPAAIMPALRALGQRAEREREQAAREQTAHRVPAVVRSGRLASTTFAMMHPIGCADLPAEHIACGYCGTPTISGVTSKHVVTGRIVTYADGMTREEPAGGTADFGTCDACRERHDLAGALIDAHPAALRAIGSRSIAVHRVAGALDALAVLGVEAPREITTEALGDLTRILAPLGIGARWSARFSPIIAADANMKQAAAKPWQHVRLVPLREIRNAYGLYLAHRQPPRMIPCPTGGCMLCGVAAVFARRVDEPWTAASLKASVVRGRSDASGHLCPTCSEARREAGHYALDAAYLEAVDPTHVLRRKNPEPPRFDDGLTAWVTTGRAPSDEPFAWTDLDRMRKLMATSGW